MNILIYNWRDIINPDGGGAEIFTHENAKRWVKMGHKVTLFTTYFKNCKNEEFIDNVRIIRCGGKLSVYKNARKYYNNYFSKEKFDIVIDEINTRPFFTQKFVNNGEKIVVLIHQLAKEFWYYETPFPINYIGDHFLEKHWLKSYVDIPTVTVSNSTKKDLVDLGFKNVSIVSEGINFTALSNVKEKEKEPTLIFIGRLKKAKRPQVLIEAFTHVKKKIPEAKLWIAGDGYMRSELEKIATEGVEFLGRISEKEKIDLMSRAWVLVNPSIREGWGINIIEANACGTPCIAFDVHGLRDSIVDGKTGILIKEKSNVETLAKTIIDFIKNSKRREEFSRNALDWSKKFNWDKSAEEFLDILQTILR
jgi:glycosyltransferase involved in cell wall biosynthesis